MLKKILQVGFIVSLSIVIIGCSNGDEETPSSSTEQSASQDNTNTESFGADFTQTQIPDITIRFGNGGNPFTMHFENNETALTIARNIGEEGRNLPINDYDNFENYEVMQYYDIPNSYNISAKIQTVNEQKAGEVYYSAPNRIVLFYQDARIPGDYIKIGTIENAKVLKTAVENNPVQEGWGKKLVLIRFADE